MINSLKKRDFVLLIVLVAVLAGLPAAVIQYDRMRWKNTIPSEAKIFTLTAHSKAGWVLGRITGVDMLYLDETDLASRPQVIIEVAKGDLVVFKLTSSDVIHGFTLKEFGIFLEDGVRPGKVILATFVADKSGIFKFSCNIICGKEHQNMQGVLVVKI